MPSARLTSALLIGWCVAAGQPTSAGEGYYANPARDIEFANVQHLNRSPRILLPTLYVKFARWGRVPLMLEAEGTEGAIVDVDAPVEPEDLRQLATRLHEDLAQRFTEAGWDVLTAKDIQDSPTWTSLEHVKPDRRFGVPFEEGAVARNPRRYLVVPPVDLPVIEAGATGPAWTMKDLVEELNATVLVATYTFDVIPFVPVQPGADGRPVTPRLQLVNVDFDFRTPGLVGGIIRAKTPETGTESSGTFTVPGAKDEERLAKALADAAVGRGKRELVLQSDGATVGAAAFAIGSVFNARVVKVISAFAPK